jgi:hypothetical protein
MTVEPPAAHPVDYDPGNWFDEAFGPEGRRAPYVGLLRRLDEVDLGALSERGASEPARPSPDVAIGRPCR